jgi:glycosyltransferase involved in cell wall biosynthesis
MKILIIPSWYPTKNSKLSGIFFLEQALSLVPKDDVRVLYIEHVSLRNFNLKYYFGNKIQSPPLGYKYSIPNIPYFSVLIGKIISFYFIYKLKKEGWVPDIIRAHGTIWGGYYAVNIGKKIAAPVIITEHRNPFILDQFLNIEKKWIKWSVENCDIFSGDGHFAVRSVLLHGFKPKKVQVYGNLVDDSKYFIKDNAFPELFTILTVTSLNYFYKDFITFLNSVIIFNNNYKAAFVCNVIVFEKIIPEYIKNLIFENNLNDKIIFHLGGVSRTDLPEFYMNSSVFVSTSITENFGVAMVESLMCGIPVISTRNGGAEDFVNPQNGYLVDIRDSASIANSLLEIAENKKGFIKSDVRFSVVDKYGINGFNLKLRNDFINLKEQN